MAVTMQSWQRGGNFLDVFLAALTTRAGGCRLADLFHGFQRLLRPRLAHSADGVVAEKSAKEIAVTTRG